VAALSVAGLTACGDKVNVTQPAPDSAVTQVTVSPASQNMNVGDKITLVATVVAGPQQTNRNVTWTSSDATVASVDNAGVVTANKGGVATIIATSAANPAIKGNAVITVAAQVLATVSIGQINQTKCDVFGSCTSVPAVLNNVANQLDVTLNVDAGTQKISEVDLIMNCGGADTIVQKQTFSTADVAPDAEDASAPTTLSFNTAAFNPTTGAVAFKNGQCTIKAKAITTAGTQSASGTQQLTLNNTDTVAATIATAPVGSQKASAPDGTGLLWKAGTVTVTAVPVIYTGGNVTVASATVNLINLSPDGESTEGSTPGNLDTLDVVATLGGLEPTAGVITATFPKDRSAAGVDSTSIKALGVQVTTVTSNGDPGPTLNASAATSIRLDNLAPDKAQPSVDLNTFNAANNWLGKAFLFTTDSSVDLGTAADDNGGVDKVTFTTQSAPFGSTTWTTFAKVTDLAETSTASSTGSYILRLVVCDALNNCTNTPNLTATGFGVDLTPPSVEQISGPTDKEIFNIDSVAPATAAFNVVDTSNTAGVTPSGPTAGAEVLVTLQGLQPSGTSSSKTICAIGNPQGSGSAITCKSPITQDQTNVPLQTAAGEYTIVVTGVDQAGNTSAPVTVKWYVDQAAPAVSGGVTIPNPITTGSSFALSATDNMDVAAGAGSLQYPGFAIFEAGTSSANGVAFDNALTRTGTVTVPLATFYRGLSATIGTAGDSPTGLNIRAVDAANNVSTNQTVALPAANMSTPGTISNSSTANGITAAAAFAAPAADTVGQTVTLSDTLTAISSTSASPFTQVCFYYASPTGTPGGTGGPNGVVAGELVKIGCSSALSASGVAPRLLAYKMTWSVPEVLRGQGAVAIYAVGVNSNLDALITTANAIAVAP
jgi:hypothetical protein